MSEFDSLPEDVVAALTAGRKIDAIKRLCEARGLSLDEAKMRIEAHLGESGQAFGQSQTDSTVPAAVHGALASGNKIEAIRLYREHFGTGLKDAKEAVERLEEHGGGSASTLAPGEVPRTKSATWIIVLAAGLCAAGYYFLR